MSNRKQFVAIVAELLDDHARIQTTVKDEPIYLKQKPAS